MTEPENFEDDLFADLYVTRNRYRYGILTKDIQL
jgi:hypothetical protein